MTDKHTPEPWRAIFDEEVNKYKIFGPRNEYIVSNTHAANARLIAAAPALLEALDKAMDDAWYNDDSNIERIEPEWIVQARDAIKAAK